MLAFAGSILGTVLSAVGDLALIAAGIMFIAIIRQVTVRERARYAQVYFGRP